MLDLGDLLNLIVLTERELAALQADIDGGDAQARNDAGEVIAQFDRLAHKLKTMYEAAHTPGSNYPTYAALIEDIARGAPD